MVSITNEELLHNLKIKYKEYQNHSRAYDEKELFYLKGFCHALEQIAVVFGDFTQEQIKMVKEPIIGNVDMYVERKEDLDISTYIRKNIDLESSIIKRSGSVNNLCQH